MNPIAKTYSNQGLIAQWLQNQHVAGSQEGSGHAQGQGRWVIAFDQVRVHLMELNEKLILLQARVMDIPNQGNASEKLLTRAMQTSCARLNTSPTGLCVDADGAALWLQVQLPTDSSLNQMTQAVQGLINEVELWRHAL
jgi:hypothetical protein